MSTSLTLANPKPIVLRVADADDALVLQWLAVLDEQPALTGETLLALIDGEAVAALSLGDGRVVSNPFVATCDAVSLLRLRAQHLLRRSARQSGRRWSRRFTHVGRAHAARLAG